jgi:hypothetical protein
MKASNPLSQALGSGLKLFLCAVLCILSGTLENENLSS